MASATGSCPASEHLASAGSEAKPRAAENMGMYYLGVLCGGLVHLPWWRVHRGGDTRHGGSRPGHYNIRAHAPGGADVTVRVSVVATAVCFLWPQLNAGAL